MPNTYTFPSPAKLNLYLHVVGQREDGYHELQTLFQFVEHGDTIEITLPDQAKNKAKPIELLTPIEGVKDEDNLIVKAALLLRNEALRSELIQNNNIESKGSQLSKKNYTAQININKILPMGGGLGGGSSNAATVMLALNILWGINFSTEKLAGLGLQLGADVPIFIHGFSAFAQGIGEQLIDVKPKEYWYLVTKPNCSISTASVFQSKDLPRNTPRRDPLSSDVDLYDVDNWHNDCQEMVIKHYPEVANLLSWLVEYAPSRMTGTGACIFSRFTSQEEACKVQDLLPTGTYSFVTRGVNTSPLRSVIEQLNS
ncbi:MAG: 4-(cytidine 5'-diphospho)-2-C-methyl-D-erythritol kinase [Colwellia sp.]